MVFGTTVVRVYAVMIDGTRAKSRAFEKWYQVGATDTFVHQRKIIFDRAARTQMIRRFEAKECDLVERVTTLEADLEGLRAEAVETRGRLRRAEESSPSAQVFER